MKPARRWREVTMEELQRIWAVFSARRVLWNGCTDWALRQIYGSPNIVHRSGHGWYKLTANADVTWTDDQIPQ